MTTKTPYDWTEGTWRGKKANTNFKVAILDFGIKKNILRILADRGYELRIFPAKTEFEELISIPPLSRKLISDPMELSNSSMVEISLRCGRFSISIVFSSRIVAAIMGRPAFLAPEQ